MVADEIIARADGPDGLKAMSARAAAAAATHSKEDSVALKGGEKRKMKIPFFAVSA
jgi:hypothetical protein